MRKSLTRLIALTICLFILISAFSGMMIYGEDLAQQGAADPAKPFEGDWDNAMHFFIRHWHSDPITSTSFQHEPDQDNATGRYFVILEGYIVPMEEEYTYHKRNSTDVIENCRFKFCLVYQDTGVFDIYDENNQPTTKYYEEGEMREIFVDGAFVAKSEYIASVDPVEGVITLKAAPSPNDSFAGLSISSGAGAIADSADRSLIPITYAPDIHLVKGHAFYVREAMRVEGTEDKKVFGENGFVQSPEQDTAWVYKNDSGDIIFKNEDGQPLENEDDRPFTEKDPETIEVEGMIYKLTRAHDNEEGLHTDKTASIVKEYELDEAGEQKRIDDGRTFNVDLEAWYSEGYAPQVGMVIDASGSMAFASDIPSPINVYDLGADVADKLGGKIGVAANDGFKEDVQIVPLSSLENLLGYYEFQQNSGTINGNNTARNWFLNSKKHSPSSTYTDMKYEYFGKVVVQSTSSTIDFSNAQSVMYIPDVQKLFPTAADWGKAPIKLDKDKGYNLTEVDGNTCASGFMPEVEPDNAGNFTISFSLMQDNNDTCRGDIEILYIGAEKGDNNYFHVIRRDNDIIATVEDTASGKTTNVVTIKNAFTKADTHKLSFVFKENKVTTYWDGVLYRRNVKIDQLSGTKVVFKPFEDKNTQFSYFWLDNVYLFNAALSADEIRALTHLAGKDLSEHTEKKTTGTFLTPEEQRLILNPHNTDNSYLGVSGYTYFVYDPTDGANGKAYLPLGYYYDPSNTRFKVQNVNEAGWYTVSHKGSSDINSNSITLKTLYGIPVSTSFTDTITAGSSRTAAAGNGAAPDMEAKYDTGNTGNTYRSTATSPVKFYIDTNGYLRCFWATSNYYASYVYELTDTQYVRTEALRRAVGSFITNLSENSPSAEVSAVRFSATTIDSKNLVMLDWTADPTESVKVMSTGRGDGTFYGYDTDKNGTELYSYALTGGTNTVTGLKAFKEKLAEKKKTELGDDYDKIPKYLIIFTDGKDDNIGTGLSPEKEKLKQETVEAANELKKTYGYTIFTVLLDGGVFDLNGTDSYVKDFLVSLSGNSGLGTNSEDYFFSIDTAKKKLKEEGWTEAQIKSMNDSDILTRIFQIEILNQITHPLEDYTIKDYIDPRFDLVDAKGIVWKLKAGGKVVKSNGEIVDVNGGTTKIIISANSNPKAREPFLCYDPEKDMYYLQWNDQNIPGSAVGANRLTVWNAQVTIRAKENFIGGNAILVGGNSKLENYVCRTGDTDPHSDAEHAGKANRGEDNAESGDSGRAVAIANESDSGEFYPSKGFPRVTVNVPPLETRSTSEATIFMGEKLALNDIIAQFMEWEGADDINDLTSGIYWEYILRYAKRSSMSQAELLAVFDAREDDGERSFIIPYYYLPNSYDDKHDDVPDSQNGTEKHMSDCLGYLRYTWQVGEHRYPEGDNLVKDTNTRNSRLSVKFTPYTEEERLNDEFLNIDYLKKLITKDDTDEIDEDLLDNVLNMVISNVLTEDISADIQKAIFVAMKERIRGTNNDKTPFADVLKDVCEDYIKDYDKEDKTNKINKNIEANDVISIKCSDINGRLIDETAYTWDQTYKPSPSEELDVQDAVTDHMVNNVISGEVLLRIGISDEDIDTIKELIDDRKLTRATTLKYTADLHRDVEGDIPDLNENEKNKSMWYGNAKGKIGTFTAEFTVGDLISKKSIYANLKLTNEQFIKAYGTSSGAATDNGWHRDVMSGGAVEYTEPIYGLPVGTYTLVQDGSNSDTGSNQLSFDPIQAITIGENDIDRFEEEGVLNSNIPFERYEAGDTIQDESGNEEVLQEGDPRIGKVKSGSYSRLLAPTTGSSARLGMKSSEESEAEEPSSESAGGEEAYSISAYGISAVAIDADGEGADSEGAGAAAGCVAGFGVGVSASAVPIPTPPPIELPDTGGHGLGAGVITGIILIFGALNIVYINRRRRTQS